jgi:hypothetical protein
VDGVLVFVSALELDNVERHFDGFFGWKTFSRLAVDDGVGVFVVATFVLGDGTALGEWRVDSESVLVAVFRDCAASSSSAEADVLNRVVEVVLEDEVFLEADLRRCSLR